MEDGPRVQHICHCTVRYYDSQQEAEVTSRPTIPVMAAGKIEAEKIVTKALRDQYCKNARVDVELINRVTPREDNK